MPRVLTTKASIVCPHGGVGTSIPSDPKWIVNGGAVLLDGDAGTLTCVFKPPCFGYQLRSMHLNATHVDGPNVMLDTDFTQSITGYPLKITEFHQTFDNSSPVPILPGQSPPPTPPELQEIDEPTVVADPVDLAFSLSAFGTSGQPLALNMIFTLQSQFPRLWILSMLSAPTGQHREITQGEPPDIIVAPAGGGWPSNNLAVTVMLTGGFMATLPVGDHHFVLTAVNFRGKSRYAEVNLKVSQ
jgi:hypothetical protein